MEWVGGWVGKYGEIVEVRRILWTMQYSSGKFVQTGHIQLPPFYNVWLRHQSTQLFPESSSDRMQVCEAGNSWGRVLASLRFLDGRYQVNVRQDDEQRVVQTAGLIIVYAACIFKKEVYWDHPGQLAGLDQMGLVSILLVMGQHWNLKDSWGLVA